MKTTEALLKKPSYKNGEPAFTGDPNRQYASALRLIITATVQKAPEGAKLLTDTNDELKRTMRKLKFGQIGALIDTEDTISSQEVLLDVVIPVNRDNVLSYSESLRKANPLSELLNGATCTVNDEVVEVSKLKDQLGEYRQSNDDIRKAWMSMADTLRQSGASPDDILEAKEKMYSNYVSISEYSVNLSIRMTHIVNNPSVGGYVMGDITEEEYSSYNYGGGRFRKTASETWPLVNIPINRVGNYVKLVSDLRQKTSTDGSTLFGLPIKYDKVIVEPFDLTSHGVTWQELREYDSSL